MVFVRLKGGVQLCKNLHFSLFFWKIYDLRLHNFQLIFCTQDTFT